MTPNWSLNDQRIMVAVMTGAMVSGKRMTVRTSGLPKKGLLRSDARPSPSISDTDTELTIRMNVLGSTIFRKTGSVKTATYWLRPTHVLSGLTSDQSRKLAFIPTMIGMI